MSQSLQGPKAEQIQRMFGEIAQGYDRANTVLSAGIHHVWRKNLVRWSGVKPGAKVLDCATGTGDLAIEFKRRAGSTGEVIGTDFCAEMLALAPAKAREEKMAIHFQTADVTALPFSTRSFDVASIAFGIRNVQQPLVAIEELARVVRPGGQVMILEFGQPRWSLLRVLYQLYSRHVLPVIGGMITGRKGAYRYLQDSSANFPCASEFVEVMEKTRLFSAVEYRSLSFGIAYMYKATVV